LLHASTGRVAAAIPCGPGPVSGVSTYPRWLISRPRNSSNLRVSARGLALDPASAWP